MNPRFAAKETFMNEVRLLVLSKVPEAQRNFFLSVPLHYEPGYISYRDRAEDEFSCALFGIHAAIVLGETNYGGDGTDHHVKNIWVAEKADTGPLALGAIVVHELAHALQGYTGISEDHGAEWEKIVSHLGLAPSASTDVYNLGPEQFTDPELPGKILALDYPA